MFKKTTWLRNPHFPINEKTFFSITHSVRVPIKDLQLANPERLLRKIRHNDTLPITANDLAMHLVPSNVSISEYHVLNVDIKDINENLDIHHIEHPVEVLHRHSEMLGYVGVTARELLYLNHTKGFTNTTIALGLGGKTVTNNHVHMLVSDPFKRRSLFILDSQLGNQMKKRFSVVVKVNPSLIKQPTSKIKSTPSFKQKFLAKKNEVRSRQGTYGVYGEGRP